MIIVRLVGGLGNQLFQYSAARRIAFKNNVELKIDNTIYNGKPSSNVLQYKLKHFNVVDIPASKKEIETLKNAKPNTFFSKIKWKLLNEILHVNSEFNKKSHIIETTGNNIDPKILNCKDNSYIEGSFGNELYFNDIKQILKKEFTLKESSNAQNRKLLDNIKSSNSVSVHFRRGDYAEGVHNSFFCLLPLSYYYLSVEHIKKYVEKPVFYIFSDDVNWVKDNFNIDYPTVYIDNNNNEEYEDLNLMMHCKHHIIANSTFSWWGAWLHYDQNIVITAPKNWYNDKDAQNDYESNNFILDTWTRI